MISITNCSNPWKDIASYEYKDASCFKGREKAIKKYLDIIDNGVFSVLYSASGIGKTSFIQAGIEPFMMNEQYVPIHIRFVSDNIYNKNGGSIDKTIISIIENQLKNKGYLWVAPFEQWPVDLNEKNTENDFRAICEESLWWRVYTYKIFDENKKDIALHPILVFDQFEEVFIKAKKYETSQFLDKLFELIEILSTPVLPSRIETIMNLLFEKGFRYKVKSERNFKIIFSLRKEYLSDFDNWTNDRFHISELLQNRMLLFPLSRSQAERVITQQPLLDINGNVVPGKYTETLIYVKDLILDKLDARHQNEIEPFLLSLLCSRLFETAKSNKQDYITEIDLEKYDLKTILSDFYQEKVDAIFNDKQADLECFENCIVDEDGFRNRIKSTKFPNVEFDNLYKEELENAHIIRVEKYGNDFNYVELVHDMLCDIIKVRKKQREKINEIRRKNQQHVQDDLNVLTIRGRRLINNTVDFGAFRNTEVVSPIEEEVFLSDNLLDFNLRNHYHRNTIIDEFAKFHADKGYSLLLEYRNDKNDQTRSIDGINKYELLFGEDTLRVRFIESIKTSSGIIDRPFYIQGYCGIFIKYETYTTLFKQDIIKKREIERTYLDENDNPVMTIDGYSMVKRHYDNEGNIDKVLFYDDNPTPQPCPHRNGNYGYKSKFDSVGLEIERIFIDRDGNPKFVTSEVAGRQFQYDSDNRIIREINIGKSRERIRDKDGYCAVEFKYDTESRISCETYLDENLRKMNGSNGYCITYTSYITNSDGTLVVEERYEDKNGNETYDSTSKGYIHRYSHNEWLKPIKFEFLNKSKTPIRPVVILHYENFRLSKITQQLGCHFYKQWIQLDEKNRYIERIGKLDWMDGKDMEEDTYGRTAYGRQYIHDQKTLVPTGFIYINTKGDHVKMKGEQGTAVPSIFEHRYDCENGKINRELYFDDKGNPISDEAGAYGRKYVYNHNGDVTKVSYLGEDGQTIVNNKYGYAYIVTDYNGNKDKEIIKYFDVNDVNVENEYGDFCIKYEYNKHCHCAETKCIHCDANGKAHNSLKGYSIKITNKDDKGREVLSKKMDVNNNIVGPIEQNDYNDEKYEWSISYYDENSSLLEGSDGWARCIYQFDDKGRLIYRSKYGEDNHLKETIKYEYPQNKVIRIRNLNQNNELYLNPYGFAIREITYDELGREIKYRYFGIDGEPVVANDGRKGYIVKYLNDRSSVEICIDGNEERCEDKYGISRKIILQDKFGRRISEFYFDKNGNPKQDLYHDFGTMYRYEDNKRFDVGLDSKGLPHKNKYGWVSHVNDNGSDIYLDEKNHKVGFFRQLFYWIGSGLRKEKAVPASHLMIRMSVEGDGYFRDSEIEGNFLLLKYQKWSEGMSIDLLAREFENQDSESVEIQYVRISPTFDGLDLGEVNKRIFPKGKLGVRIKTIFISEGLYKEIMLMWEVPDVMISTRA